jgi:hypothetical protein
LFVRFWKNPRIASHFEIVLPLKKNI